MRPGPDPSALYLLVPAAEPLLDAVRELPGVSLLEPAHISLGYPWLDAGQALERLDEVRAVVAATAAWEVELDGPERFDVDVRGRQVVYLRPADDRPFAALAEALGGRLGRPHLSVARVLAGAGLPGVERVEAVLRPLLPLRTRIDHVEVTVRLGPSSWSTVLQAPLGVQRGPRHDVWVRPAARRS
ncbi:MAG: 2-5 ligase family protein [Frankiales bacterium]|nr:2-5 ligase family protein [Frankiales bacterium]